MTCRHCKGSTYFWNLALAMKHEKKCKEQTPLLRGLLPEGTGPPHRGSDRGGSEGAGQVQREAGVIQWLLRMEGAVVPDLHAVCRRERL